VVGASAGSAGGEVVPDVVIDRLSIKTVPPAPTIAPTISSNLNDSSLTLFVGETATS